MKIIDGIGCTPRNNGRFPIVKDEPGGFAGNTRNLAVNKLVCHQIAIHGNRTVAKLLDDFQISCFEGSGYWPSVRITERVDMGSLETVVEYEDDQIFWLA